VIVTWAPATTAPLLSVTVPVIPALAWAEAVRGVNVSMHPSANASAMANHVGRFDL